MPLQSGQTESGLYNYGLSPHQLARGTRIHTETQTYNHQKPDDRRERQRVEEAKEGQRTSYTMGERVTGVQSLVSNCVL